MGGLLLKGLGLRVQGWLGPNKAPSVQSLGFRV